MNTNYISRSNNDFFCISSTLPREAHFHNEIDIIYVNSGGCDVFINGSYSRLVTGDLFIAFPNQIHYYVNTIEGEYYNLSFLPHMALFQNSIFYENIPENNIIHLDKESDCARILKFIANLKTPYQATALVGTINVLISVIVPQLKLIDHQTTKNSLIQNIIYYCLNNYTKTISLDIVAKELHTSKYYISHLLNDKLNISFSDCVNNMRITLACNLLLTTDKKISQIATETGFGSIRSFNIVFHKFMKCTPNEYRNMSAKQFPLYNSILL